MNITLLDAILSTICSQVYLGAKGTTKDEMKSILHFPEDSRLISDFQNTIQSLNPDYQTEKFTLETANSIFVDQEYELKRKYESNMKIVFRSKTMKTDFSDADKSARYSTRIVKTV